jgi:hypothetical protein
MRPHLRLFICVTIFAFAQPSLAQQLLPDWGGTYQLDLGWQDDGEFFTAYSSSAELGHIDVTGNVYEQYSAEEGPVIGGGYGEAEVKLRNGALNGIEPSLRAYIRTGGGHALWSGGARARAIEVYENAGSAPLSVDLDIALHGTFSSSGTIYAYVAAFAGRGVFEPDPQQHPLLASSFIALLASGETGDGTLNFVLNPGASFTLWSQLSLNATGSREFADALSTLEMSFRDTSHLVPQSVVPLPAPFALLVSGVVIAGRLARRTPSLAQRADARDRRGSTVLE